MFQFYQSALEWYLQSKLARFARSFNENLAQIFQDAKEDLEDKINELYREAALGNTAMVAMINGKVSHIEAELRRQRRNYEVRDTLAGHRMQTMMQATWIETKHLQWMIESARLSRPAIEPASSLPQIKPTGITRTQAQALGLNLESFINGEEGPALFDKGRFWFAEDGVLLKLRTWMTEEAVSRTLWISSPYEPGVAVLGSRAAALATVAAAWQAESPVISYFCKRPLLDRLKPGMSIEQVGLMALVYSFIQQLLQFNGPDVELDFDKNQFSALNGTIQSWEPSLKVLRALLRYTPVLMFCVIDGLNDLEWGDGMSWCKQFLELLDERQRQAGSIFNVLFTTAGQSCLLPLHVEFKDRQMTTKKAREVQRSGRMISFHSAQEPNRDE
jgi:hypothetical protein